MGAIQNRGFCLEAACLTLISQCLTSSQQKAESVRLQEENKAGHTCLWDIIIQQVKFLLPVNSHVKVSHTVTVNGMSHTEVGIDLPFEGAQWDTIIYRLVSVLVPLAVTLGVWRCHCLASEYTVIMLEKRNALPI